MKKWMQSTWAFCKKRSVIVAVSCICAVVIISVSGAAFLLLQRSMTKPEDLLRAEATLAFVTNLDRPTLEHVQRLFPHLGNVPELKSSETAALVRTGNDGKEWIVFIPQTDAPGTFTVRASPAAQTALTSERQTLGDNAEYRRFAQERQEGDGWIYIAPELISANGNALPTQSPVAILRRGSLSRVLIVSDAISAFPPAGRDLVAAFDDPIFAAQFSDWRSFARAAWMEQDPDVRAITMALLQQTTKRYLGNAVQLERDIAPLFRGSVQLQVAKWSGTGAAVRFLIAGQPPFGSGTDLAALLGHLHERFAEGFVPVTVFQRDLDDGFSIRDIRLDPTAIQTDQTKVGRWAIHTTQHTGVHRHLVTAINGDRFMISNDSGALLRLAGDNGTLPAIYLGTESRPLTHLHAGGYLLTPAVSALLPPSLAQQLLARLPLPWENIRGILWTVEAGDGVLSITLSAIESQQSTAPNSPTESKGKQKK